MLDSPTRDKSGHKEHARKGRTNFWLSQQGQLFSYKRSIQWLGGEGNPPPKDYFSPYKQALTDRLHLTIHNNNFL